MVDDDTTTATTMTTRSPADCTPSILSAISINAVILQLAERKLDTLRDAPPASRVCGWRLRSATFPKASWNAKNTEPFDQA
jgi:hypothetical protein